MKKLFSLSALILAATLSNAQVRTPSPSPGASITQVVGVTDLSVKYSRPSMKGREIFGKLLPFDKVWRTGANQPTLFEISNDIMVEGQKLMAGKYALLSIPGATEFTVIFSKNAGSNEQNYKMEEDALRVKVKSVELPTPMQSFGIGFSDITDSTANMYFAWDKTRVPMKLSVETTAIVESSIDKAAETSNTSMTQGANYLLGKGKSMDKALSLINQATGAKETVQNLWIKAQILGKLGKFAEAIPFAQKALDLGNAANNPNFGTMKDAITKGMDEMKAKLPALPAVPGMKKK